MAAPEDIVIVRNNTNEPTETPYTDEYLGGLVDALGVTGATVTIWEQKVARFSSAIDVTEAGATHKFSSLFDNAVKMLAYWKGVLNGETPGTTDGIRVREIARTGQ